LGAVLGVLVGVWARTLRVHVEWQIDRAHESKLGVYAFFHGQQMALLGAVRRRKTAVLVSHSEDGDIQAGAMRRLGFSVERGSSSRGGAMGLRAILRRLALGEDVALAVDGPRGPNGIAKRGAVVASKATGAMLFPVASAAQNALTLEGAWDRFEIPIPFSRVAVVVGAPMHGEADADRLSAAIVDARRRAEALLTIPRG